MLRIAICDDETIFRTEIKEIIEKYMSEQELQCVIDTFASGKEFVELELKMLDYQIVFLDINMEEMDGIETAREIRRLSESIQIALVTAYITYASDGYKVDAIRFILKNNSHLKESIYECMDAICTKINFISEKREFKFAGGEKKISLQNILYIESKLHRLEFNIIEDRLNQYMLYGTVDEIEEEIKGNGFVRVHQSYLVNMKHIKKLSRYQVILNGGIVIDVPRARYKYVEEIFTIYKGEL